jgi:hypothetical protein
MADSPLSESLAVLSQYFVGTGTLQDTLFRVSESTEKAIGPVDFVGITLPVEGGNRTAVFTDPASPEIDQAQYDAGVGPCLDALKMQRIQTVSSTREEGPWPEFRRAAADHGIGIGIGIGSTLSLPLIVEDRVVGAMNLNAQTYSDAYELTARLGEAMKSRATIEQAKGILMGTHGCGPETAFDLLTRAAQREEVTVREMARRTIVDATGREPVD